MVKHQSASGRKGSLQESELLGLAERLAEQIADIIDQQGGSARFLLDPSRIKVDEEGRIVEAPIEIDYRNSLKPHYHSPEMAAEQTELSFPSWAYTLGAFIYHLATGVKPFGEYHENEIASKAPSAVLPEANKLNPNLSPHFTALLMKMLAKKISARPSSIGELRLDITQVRKGEWPMRSPSLSTADGNIRGSLPFDLDSADMIDDSARRRNGFARQVSVSREVIAQTRQQQRKRRRKATVSSLFYVLFVLGAFYGGWHYYLRDLMDWDFAAIFSQKEKDDDVSEIPEFAHDYRPQRPPLESRPVRSGTERPRPTIREAEPGRTHGRERVRATEPERGREGEEWNNPDYQRAKRLYDEAMELYLQTAQLIESGERPNQQSLVRIEENARQSSLLFHSIRDEAPAYVPINSYIRQSNQMLADARLSRQLAPAGQERRPPVTAPDSTRSVRRPPQSVLINGMVLAMNWNLPQSGNRMAVEELKNLLSSVAQPRIDVTISQRTTLWEDIGFREPMRSVAERKGLGNNPRQLVTAPGWPHGSIGLHTFPGSFENGRYNSLTLITDLVDQVVGLRLSSSQPARRRIAAGIDETRWRVLDLLTGRINTDHTRHISRMVSSGEGVVRIETEIAVERAQGQMQPLEHSLLILSEPLADLLLYRTGQLR